MKIAVIGGGPSGLVTLKYLTQAHEFLNCEPVEARLFDYQPQVGGTFSARVYEDAEVRMRSGQAQILYQMLTTFQSWSRQSNLLHSQTFDAQEVLTSSAPPIMSNTSRTTALTLICGDT